jgi:hypothetical protein
MSVTQIVEIPVSRQLIIDVPREVPVGPVILTFTPKVPSPSVNLLTIEESLQIAEMKASDPNRKPISQFFGILSPNTYGDGVAYQRNIRNDL